MSLSAQSQVAVMSANEVWPQHPLGELHERRWCSRVCKHADTHVHTQSTWIDGSDFCAVRKSGSICDKQEGLSDPHAHRV